MYSLILDLGKQVRDIKMNLEIKENIVSKLKIRPDIKLPSLPMDDYNIFMSFGRSIQGEEGKHARHALVPNFFSNFRCLYCNIQLPLCIFRFVSYSLKDKDRTVTQILLLKI